MTDDLNRPLDEGMNEMLSLNATAIANLRTAGKWGKFLAIVGFIFIGLSIFGLLLGGGSMLFLLLSASGSGGAAGGFGTLILIFYGLIFLFVLYIYWQLYQFSINAVKAADSGSQVAMAESMKSLATIFRIAGILTTIFLGMYGLMILAGVFGAFIAGM